MVQSASAPPPCHTIMSNGHARASATARNQPAGKHSLRNVTPSRCQSSIPATTGRMIAAPKPMPLTSDVAPRSPKNIHRASCHRGPLSSGSAPVIVAAASSLSNATSAQVIKQASRMSASAKRPRSTVHAVVAWMAPESMPIVGPKCRAASTATPSTKPIAARADGIRATASFTPPERRPTAAASHQGRGGFSSHGRPPIVGYIHSPEWRISLAPCATNAS